MQEMETSLRATRSNPDKSLIFIVDRRGGYSRLAMTNRSVKRIQS
jgi:hypothetical protein